MNIRIFLFLFIILVTSVLAQDTITENQILLNGYVDTSGKVLLTGYVTPESLPYMPFLNDTQYTFDNNTNQMYAVTNKLTDKKEDAWSLNFSIEGYYTDYSVTFYLPAGSEITKLEIQPELNYQLQVKEDSLIVSIHGYRVVSPWIKLDYKLPADIPGQSNGIINSVLPVSLIIVIIAGAIFIFYRYRKKKAIVIPETKESQDQEIKDIPEIEQDPKQIHITDEMQKVIDTLSDKEKAIIGLLIRNGGSSTQADIRYETRIPKSSLTGIINALKRKNIVKKLEYGRTNLIELSEWFLSNKESK